MQSEIQRLSGPPCRWSRHVFQRQTLRMHRQRTLHKRNTAYHQRTSWYRCNHLANGYIEDTRPNSSTSREMLHTLQTTFSHDPTVSHTASNRPISICDLRCSLFPWLQISNDCSETHRSTLAGVRQTLKRIAGNEQGCSASTSRTQSRLLYARSRGRGTSCMTRRETLSPCNKRYEYLHFHSRQRQGDIGTYATLRGPSLRNPERETGSCQKSISRLSKILHSLFAHPSQPEVKMRQT